MDQAGWITRITRVDLPRGLAEPPRARGAAAHAWGRFGQGCSRRAAPAPI